MNRVKQAAIFGMTFIGLFAMGSLVFLSIQPMTVPVMIAFGIMIAISFATMGSVIGAFYNDNKTAEEKIQNWEAYRKYDKMKP